MTFTWTVWLSASPKPLYAAQLKVPESFLLISFIVSTFPSCSKPVFPWFPVFSLVQVMFGSGLPDASHVNCKLLPSRTICSPLISVISAGTKSRKSLWKKKLNTLQWQFLSKHYYVKGIRWENSQNSPPWSAKNCPDKKVWESNLN